MVARKQQLGKPPLPTEELLETTEFGVFLGTLRAATEVIGNTEQILRDADAGLSTREFDALVFVVAFGPIRPSELLRRVVMTHSAQTLSSVLDRLERDGLLKRGPHPDDPRAVLVEATNDGRTLIAELFPTVKRKVIEPFTSEYADDELEIMSDLLSRQ